MDKVRVVKLFIRATTNMLQWYPEVLHFCPTTPIILVGLKSDLRNKRTCIDLLKTQGLTPVTTAQGQAVANKMGAMYMECSSKEMIGVHEIFETAIELVVAESEGVPISAGSFSNNSTGGAKAGAGSGVRNTSSSQVEQHRQKIASKKKKSRSCKIL